MSSRGRSLLSWGMACICVRHTYGRKRKGSVFWRQAYLPAMPVEDRNGPIPAELQSGACRMMSPTCPQLHARHECTDV